jgi:hypothetical protein
MYLKWGTVGGRGKGNGEGGGQYTANQGVPDHEKPGSQCRLSKAHN